MESSYIAGNPSRAALDYTRNHYEKIPKIEHCYHVNILNSVFHRFLQIRASACKNVSTNLKYYPNIISEIANNIWTNIEWTYPEKLNMFRVNIDVLNKNLYILYDNRKFSIFESLKIFHLLHRDIGKTTVKTV